MTTILAALAAIGKVLLKAAVIVGKVVAKGATIAKSLGSISALGLAKIGAPVALQTAVKTAIPLAAEVGMLHGVKKATNAIPNGIVRNVVGYTIAKPLSLAIMGSFAK